MRNGKGRVERRMRRNRAAGIGPLPLPPSGDHPDARPPDVELCGAVCLGKPSRQVKRRRAALGKRYARQLAKREALAKRRSRG